jgi:hypothetical protein
VQVISEDWAKTLTESAWQRVRVSVNKYERDIWDKAEKARRGHINTKETYTKK